MTLFAQAGGTVMGNLGIVFEAVTLAILGVSSAILLFIGLIKAVASVRDTLVEDGFVDQESWLGRQRLRRKRNALRELLAEIGFTDEHRAQIGVLSRRTRSRRRTATVSPDRLCGDLLKALKGCTYVDPDGNDLLPTTGERYVDTMGAISGTDPNSSSLPSIVEKWLHLLVAREVMSPFDMILVHKNGNSTLAHHSAALYASGKICPKVITWKSYDDRSRVSRPSAKVPHLLDFEGLWSYCVQLQDSSQPDVPSELTVIALDDNFTTGSSLVESIKQFNELVARDKLPFSPIQHAVVLFAISDPSAEEQFRAVSEDFQVHAVFTLGPDELRSIVEQKLPTLKRDLDQYTRGFACRVIRQMVARPRTKERRSGADRNSDTERSEV